MVLTGTVWARDPVPAELEKATPEVRRKQMEATEQKDLESHLQKLHEGQRRYQERLEFKTGIVADLNRDVSQQQREREAAFIFSPRRAPDSAVPLFVKSTGSLLALVVLGYCFLLWWHFFRRSVRWMHFNHVGARRSPPRGQRQPDRGGNRRGRTDH